VPATTPTARSPVRNLSAQRRKRGLVLAATLRSASLKQVGVVGGGLDRPRHIGDTCSMEQRNFSAQEARDIGERIGIDWESSRFDVEQFRMGLEVELEHGRRDPVTNVSNDDEVTTAKIAWAHLNEFPDYYTRLAKMEAEAERDWAAREGGQGS
jgi:Protein of unknown function (DUF5661)